MAGNALENGYRAVADLQHGQVIYLYGDRQVIDVHNLPKSKGGPVYVSLQTTDGTFRINRNTLVATRA